MSIQLRRSDEQRLTLERSLEPLRESIGKLQLEQQAASLGGAQYMEQLTAAAVDLAQLAAGQVQNGQVVVFDSGTTPLLAARIAPLGWHVQLHWRADQIVAHIQALLARDDRDDPAL